MICQHGNRRALCIQCHPPADRPRLGHDDLSITRTPSGGIHVAAMVDGTRRSTLYYGFGERRARRAFIKEHS